MCSEDGKGFQLLTIDSQTFPNTPSAVFWSSSPVADDANLAWSVGFGYGNDVWYVKYGAFQVRLVRSGQ